MQNEKQLLEKALLDLATGNKDGLIPIYENLGRMIFSVALGITGKCQDAEDTLQETLIELIKYAHTYKKGTNPRAFILTIARNNALDAVRKNKNHLPIDEEMIITDDEISDAAPFAAELLSHLCEDEREIILLRIYSELSFFEVAKIMNISIFAAQKRYQRVLKKLKSIAEVFCDEEK